MSTNQPFDEAKEARLTLELLSQRLERLETKLDRLLIEAEDDDEPAVLTGDDDLYDEAREIVREAGKASSSLLQRRLRVGYARAAHLLDLLEQNGVISPANGAKPRDVLE